MKKKLFIALESIIYIAFLVGDIFNIFNTTYLKYLGIILCFLYSLTNKKIYGIFSFTFTLLADFFLLVKNDNYSLGILFFIVVQIIYTYYLHNLNCNDLLLFRILLPIILILIIKPHDTQSILALIYFPQLVISTLTSFKKDKLLALGLLLFVCCDICVGLHNILAYSKIIAILQWLFYLPSQVLISLAIKKSS